MNGHRRTTGNGAFVPPSRPFLSSTVRDLGDYRERVKATLNQIRIHACLGEEWRAGLGRTVDQCYEAFQACDGYIGIFAYWYGSIPPGRDRSITHIEFDWARERWPRDEDSKRRIAVFLPGWRQPVGRHGQCEAASELTKRAQGLIQDWKGPGDHDELLRAFKNVVSGRDEWFFANYFETRDGLAQDVLVTYYQWQGQALEAARCEFARRLEPRRPTKEELGRLGRGKQIEAVENLRDLLHGQATAPGLCMLVHGHERGGHHEFQTHLNEEVLSDAEAGVGRPPGGTEFDVASLVDCIHREARCRRPLSEPSVDELADALHDILDTKAVTVLVPDIHRLRGGVHRLHADLWAPLHAGLAARRARTPRRYQLLLVGFVMQSWEDGWTTFADECDQDSELGETSRLKALPELGLIQKGQLMSWLRELEVPDKPPGHRAELADRALRGMGNEPDGTPVMVYRRLELMDLWSEGGSDE
jgi:hypothetical protein